MWPEPATWSPLITSRPTCSPGGQSARYDAVFMGFWVSHVPAERWASFSSLVVGCLKPEGRVFFCDDAYRTEDELTEDPDQASSAATPRTAPPAGS